MRGLRALLRWPESPVGAGPGSPGVSPAGRRRGAAAAAGAAWCEGGVWGRLLENSRLAARVREPGGDLYREIRACHMRIPAAETGSGGWRQRVPSRVSEVGPANTSLDDCPTFETLELPAGAVGTGGDIRYTGFLVVRILNV